MSLRVQPCSGLTRRWPLVSFELPDGVSPPAQDGLGDVGTSSLQVCDSPDIFIPSQKGSRDRKNLSPIASLGPLGRQRLLQR